MFKSRQLPILTSVILGTLLLAYWVHSQQTVGVGYAVIQADEGTPIPIVSALFQFRNEAGVLISEAGIEAVDAIASGRIFVDQDGTRTGVALVNSSPDPATLDLVLRDGSGGFIAQTSLPWVRANTWPASPMNCSQVCRLISASEASPSRPNRANEGLRQLRFGEVPIAMGNRYSQLSQW